MTFPSTLLMIFRFRQRVLNIDVLMSRKSKRKEGVRESTIGVIERPSPSSSSMEKKKSATKQGQLNFDAPLLSLRKNSVSPVLDSYKPNPHKANGDGKINYRRSDVRSLRDPGTVPFGWEHSPGRPKDEGEGEGEGESEERHFIHHTMNESRRVQSFSNENENGNERVMSAANQNKDDRSSRRIVKRVESDEFSDAVEAMSQSETCTAAWSVSMVSGMEDHHHNLTADENAQARNFMMDRFLPAAKAMASESPHTKPTILNRDTSISPRPNHHRQDPLPLQSRQYAVKPVTKDFEEEAVSSSKYSPKACGLFPWRFRYALCSLSPVSHSHSRRSKKKPSSTLKSNAFHSDGDPLSATDTDDEELTWEAIYRQKIVNGARSNSTIAKRNAYQGQRHDDFSADTSPRRISCGSDSHLSKAARTDLRHHHHQLVNSNGWSASPSYRTASQTPPRPRSAGISPYRNGAPVSPFSQGSSSGFLGFPKSSDDLFEYPLKTNSKHSEAEAEAEAEAEVETARKSCNSVTDAFAHDQVTVWNNVPSKKCVDGITPPSDSDFRSARDAESFLSRKNLLASMAMLELTKEKDTNKGNGHGRHDIDRDINLGNKKSSGDHIKSKKRGMVVAVRNGNGHSSPPPLPPPLPKSPSESWQWRTMPRTPSPSSRLSRMSRSSSPCARQHQQQHKPHWESVVRSAHTPSIHQKFRSQEHDRLHSPPPVRTA